MTTAGWSAYSPVVSRLRVAAGGAPSPAELAALTAAVAGLLGGERAAPAVPTPAAYRSRPRAAYRSRWRRAALVELTDVPPRVKDTGPAWGGSA